MSTAVYVSSSSFNLEDADWRNVVKEGQRILLTQGVDGTAETYVDSVSYSGGDTTVTTATAVVTSNLEDAKFGTTYSDPSETSGNIGVHGHTSAGDGGYLPISSLTDAQITALQTIPTLSGDANKVLGVASGGSTWELKTIAGTSNQVTVTHTPNTVTLALPQNIHTGASPTFAGLNIASGNVIIASGATLNHTGKSGIPYVSGGLYNYSATFKQLADVHADVSDSAAEGDLLLYTGGTWTRLGTPDSYDYYLVSNGGTPAWRLATGTTTTTTTTSTTSTTTTSTTSTTT